LNATTPTSSTFTLGVDVTSNKSTDQYVAYLFGEVAGVSKIGTYTGNGTSLNVACGFTAGARFVIIKRTDAIGDWYLWNTTTGIIVGNDPHLSLNTSALEITADDSLVPLASGFTTKQNATTNINVTNGTYIFLAIA
jgi:hypothetical protein